MKQQERYQIFADVYENNRWGKSPSGCTYYSDSPSLLTMPYREFVTHFIKQHDVKRIVDLGCGDFEASSGIDMGEAHYVGIDIYDKLIEYDIEHYGDEKHEFLVRDFVEEDLPEGDLCLITLVLYLLAFDEVVTVLRKLGKYRYILITDGQPNIEPSQRQNFDKRTDKNARTYYDKGFYLELPPFDLPLTVVCEYEIPSGYNNSREIIRTILLESPGSFL